MTNNINSNLPARQKPLVLQDVIQRPFMCAELGLLFIGTFKRNDAGIFCWMKSEPMLPVPGVVVGQGEQGHHGMVPADKMNFTGFTCHWCHASSGVFKCGSCQQFVCGGRSEDNTFTCTEECGQEAAVVDGAITEYLMVDGLSGNLDGSARRAIGYDGD